jgi:hypothetical protein
MTQAQTIPELDRKGLRDFALVTGAIVAALFGLFFPWLLDRGLPSWPWILAGVLALWGLVAPTTLKPVYRGWMRFGLLANRIMTPLVLGLIYFVVITPVAFIMRALGRDAMLRKLDSGAQSYRVPSRTQPKEKMERPF